MVCVGGLGELLCSALLWKLDISDPSLRWKPLQRENTRERVSFWEIEAKSDCGPDLWKPSGA